MRALRLLRHLRVLRIEPGDVLVYRLPLDTPRVSIEMRTHLREDLERAFPGVRVVVLDRGDLAVVRDRSALAPDAAASSRTGRRDA